MKIYMEHKTYIKDGNKWILDYDYEKKKFQKQHFYALLMKNGKVTEEHLNIYQTLDE